MKQVKHPFGRDQGTGRGGVLRASQQDLRGTAGSPLHVCGGINVGAGRSGSLKRKWIGLRRGIRTVSPCVPSTGGRQEAGTLSHAAHVLRQRASMRRSHGATWNLWATHHGKGYRHAIPKVYTERATQAKHGFGRAAGVEKDCRAGQAYGTVDELNASVGLVRAMNAEGGARLPLLRRNRGDLRWVQNKLFDVGSLLATAPGQPFRTCRPSRPAM